jgi:DNA-binding response OmpR family regulator
MVTLAKNIYLSDDDPDDREFFQVALDEVCPDCKLITSSNGYELLEQLQNPSIDSPDVIFLDINMPKKNGLESLEEIRNNTAFSSVPVIMFSTSDNRHHVEAAQRLGAALYMVKPSDFQLLKNRISEIILDNDFVNRPDSAQFLLH